MAHTGGTPPETGEKMKLKLNFGKQTLKLAVFWGVLAYLLVNYWFEGLSAIYEPLGLQTLFGLPLALPHILAVYVAWPLGEAIGLGSLAHQGVLVLDVAVAALLINIGGKKR